MSEVHTSYMPSPIGVLMLSASETGLRRVALQDSETNHHTEQSLILQAAERQLKAYFDGKLHEFDLPFDFSDAPPFHQEVWQALCSIPFGEKVSYKNIAEQLGQPLGSQAVGQANAKNPIAIVIPCHRVVGSNGNLTGYAWGLDCKRWLLKHELAHRPKPVHLLF